ncbi:dihydrofolate reductase family protein [Streptomyces sp. Je 1-369]|uniref:dihydrofolate reductase family protein n=1 Tax=Streptomyces sp. Je 1-369 TaxID=2966192 RepID=UPI0022856255|nr:dihydrofolate reductase family protein [Streptomyces sp. Je 1-369]WAL97946.1 dihydrofolate reductase family protein [Streptomyces sp. Je 1-369]
MRKLVYFIAVSLDGFIAGPDGADPTGPDGFWPIGQDYIQHLAETYPETLPAPAREALGVTAEGTHFDTVLEGRRTYGIGLDAGLTNAYPHLRHYVFSRTLTESPDPGVELVASDPVEKVRQLKEEDGKDIWLCGGGELAGVLRAEIDRLVVKIGPLTLGSGTPLFAQKTAFDPVLYERSDAVLLDSGTIFLTYDKKA